MAAASIRTAGVFLVLVPTVAYGGVSLLGFISRRAPGYLDNPVPMWAACSWPSGPSPWASGSCAPDAPYPPKVSPTPLALRPGPSPCGFGSRPCDRWVV